MRPERARSRASYARAKRIGQWIAVPMLAVIFGLGIWSAVRSINRLTEQGQFWFVGTLVLGAIVTLLIYRLLRPMRYGDFLSAVLGSVVIGLVLSWVTHTFGVN